MSLLFIVFLLGLAFGSFLSAYTYRVPRGISVMVGRSRCPKCGEKISWYDNIPLLSYLVLSGRCRRCSKKISLRYPLIEFSTGVLFVFIYYILQNCEIFGGPMCEWQNRLGFFTLPFFIFLASALIAVFVIDIEHQIILDEIVFAVFVISFLVLLVSGRDDFFGILLASFAGAIFLLFLHVVTLGRGMGLGDVKFSLLPGLILGYSYTPLYFVTSFIVGGFVGIVLIAVGKANFGKRIAFGPFLVLAFFIIFFFGQFLKSSFFPFEF